MRELEVSNKFKRDYKKHSKATASTDWVVVIYKLLNDETLPHKYCDHALTGDWRGFRDCHINPDLVLIYRKYDNVLQLVRLGSHAELKLA